MSGYIGNIPVPQATQTRDNFTATSGQTTFSTSGYTPSYLDVYLNGVHLDPSDYTATNGTDVVLGTGATAGDIVSVVAFSTFETVDQDFSGDFSVDGSTFVVDSTNNRVGIGTSSPSAPIHLKTSGSAELRLEQDGAGYGSIKSSDFGILYLDADAGNTAASTSMRFRVDGTERMRIDSSGRVGIGTSSPTSPIEIYLPTDISMNASATGHLEIQGNGYGAAIALDAQGVNIYNNSSSRGIIFGTNETERMRIDGSGRVTTPYQPAFQAYLTSASLQSQGVSLVGGTWGTRLNRGSHYNTSNRRFTAPVDGVYHFDCILGSVGSTGAVSYLSAELWINGSRTQIGAWEGSGSSSYVGSSQSFVQYMNAGDYAELGCEVSKAFTPQAQTTYNSTIFSGYLVG